MMNNDEQEADGEIKLASVFANDDVKQMDAKCTLELLKHIEALSESSQINTNNLDEEDLIKYIKTIEVKSDDPHFTTQICRNGIVMFVVMLITMDIKNSSLLSEIIDYIQIMNKNEKIEKFNEESINGLLEILIITGKFDILIQGLGNATITNNGVKIDTSSFQILCADYNNILKQYGIIYTQIKQTILTYMKSAA